MATIKDIAILAGVSHGTVSNVLNKTGKVSTDKMRRVMDAAKELGYVPNVQAQLLRQGSSNTVALILPTILEDTYRTFYLALLQSLKEKGFTLELYQTNDIAEEELQILSSLSLPALAALIVISSPGDLCLSFYEHANCPVIFVNRTVPIHNNFTTQICFDFSKIGSQIGDYVLKKSWKQIAFFSSSSNPSDESELFNGICTSLAAYNISVQKFTSDNYLMINRAFSIFSQSQQFDAVIAVGNLRAEAVSSALRFLEKSESCELLCIGNKQTFSYEKPEVFALDFGKMAAKVSELFTSYLQNGYFDSPDACLSAKGFSFQFPLFQKEESITMLTLESPTTAALEYLLPYLKKTTGIDLKITALGYNDLHTQIREMNNQICYDLVRMDTALLDTFGQNIYLPLKDTSLFDSERIKNIVKNAPKNYTHSQNILYALPLDPSVQILLYRKDLFDDDILQRAYYETFREQLHVPETIEQWQKTARFFTRGFNPHSPTLYGTTLTCGRSAIAACDFLPYYLSLHASFPKEDKLFDTESMRASLEQYASMTAYAPQVQHWWKDSVRQFADGNIATVMTFSNHASYILNSNYTNIMKKTGIAPIPGRRPLLGGGSLGICKNTQKQDACCTFLEWLFHPDITTAIVRLGGASPVSDAYFQYENRSVFPWLSTIGENFSLGTRGNGIYEDLQFSAPEYELALGTAVYQMIQQQLSPAETAKKAQEIYDRSI